jgi:hypothetical protein
LPVNIQQLDGRGTLQKGKLKHELSGTLFGGKVQSKGLLSFNKIKDQTLITAYSSLILDHIQLDWVPIIHKGDWSPTSGTVTGNLKIQGSLPTNEKTSSALKVKGILEGEKLVLGNSKGLIEKLKLNFKEGSFALTQAEVALEKIKVEDLQIKKFLGLFNITPEKIHLSNGRILPLNGLINLIGNFKPKSGAYNFKFKGDNLKVEEFSPKLAGRLQLQGTMNGTLPQKSDNPGLNDYARDFSGDIKIKLEDGTLPELGALEAILTLLNPNSFISAAKEGMSYDYLGGDFKIVKGLVETKNFKIKTPQIMLNAVTQANLVEDSISGEIKAMPLQILDKAIKLIPLLGQILTSGKKGGVIETYFKIHGKVSKPEFTIQPQKFLLNKPANILNELINIPKNLTRKDK